jgi:hypothetical protein
MVDERVSDLRCVLSRTGDCIANVSMACFCLKMPEAIYRAELRRVGGPPCDHSAWKGISAHGRCCPECGHFMVDFGD